MHASKYGAPGTGVRSNSPISRPNVRGPNPSVSALVMGRGGEREGGKRERNGANGCRGGGGIK